MADATADQPPVCYRCDDRLDGAHWIRLAAAHQGDRADDYSDVETRVCPDCLAAMGLLEFSPVARRRAIESHPTQSGEIDPTTGDASDDESLLTKHSRLAPLRSLRGGD